MHTQPGRQTDRHAQSSNQADIHTDMHTQSGRQTGPGRQTNRQIERQGRIDSRYAPINDLSKGRDRRDNRQELDNFEYLTPELKF